MTKIFLRAVGIVFQIFQFFFEDPNIRIMLLNIALLFWALSTA